MSWEKRGDAIRDAEDLLDAIKKLCKIEGVYWMYPVRLRTADDPLVVVASISHTSLSEWGGQETAVTNTFSCDIYTRKHETLERLVKDISSALLSNNVRLVGRFDGRDGVSQRFSAHLTLQASYDVFGRTFRGT